MDSPHSRVRRLRRRQDRYPAAAPRAAGGSHLGGMGGALSRSETCTACDACRRGSRGMRRAVVVLDDFYSDPEAVRRYALAQPTYYPYQARADVEAGKVAYSWMTTMFREADN